jgi:hypothetical protein
MIVPALLRGWIDFRHFLGEGECEGEFDVYVVFSLVCRLFGHSELVNVYLFWTMRCDVIIHCVSTKRARAWGRTPLDWCAHLQY